jgi:Squalene-hopene cyclase C-terminal domain
MKNKILIAASWIVVAVVLGGALTGWVKKDLPVTEAGIVQAAAKALQILQKSGHKFTMTRRCASCHHNTLTSMAAGLARQKGVPMVDTLATERIMSMVISIQYAGDPNRQNDFVNAKFLIPYELNGLAAEKYPADFSTDVAVSYVLSQAKKDGSWDPETFRVPMEDGNIHLTALSIRSIRLYAPAGKKKQADELAARTGKWLEAQNPSSQQELSFQLLGLHWCGAEMNIQQRVSEKLRELQRPDGGWSQLPTMSSDAYATGQALCALSESGMIRPQDACYQKGLEYLLKTQDEEGAWAVETRSYPIQPFRNTDFPPYDENQFISAAGSNWALMALLNALPDKTN